MAIEGDDTGANANKDVVLSQGAAVALGNVLNRVIQTKELEPSKKSEKRKGKRPRPAADTKVSNKPIVLAENEDVLKDISEEREQKRRQKEHKRKKLQFEQNARVVPDAASGAALEKTLLTIATKGTVALFNAVSKAQRVSNENKATTKQKGPAVSKKAFMDMMKENIAKMDTAPLQSENDEDQAGSYNETKKPPRLRAKWLKEDYLTSKAKRLKDWDRAEVEAESSDAESEDPDNSESSGDEDELAVNEEAEDEIEEEDILSEEESEMEEEYE